jgi:hypothetical protein
MAQAVPLSAMPGAFAAGTTLTYTKSLSGYLPSAGWAMTLYLGGVELLAPVSASTSGDAFVVSIAASATSPLDPGNYYWEERVTKGAEEYVADSGYVEVLPNVKSAVAGTFETFEEKQLAVVEAAIAKRLPEGMESYQIAGRAVTLVPEKELWEIRTKLINAIHLQKNPGSFTTPVRIAFTGTGNERS